MSRKTVILPDETPEEHLRNALQLFHELRTYAMTSAQAVANEDLLNTIEARVRAALGKIEKKRTAL